MAKVQISNKLIHGNRPAFSNCTRILVIILQALESFNELGSPATIVPTTQYTVTSKYLANSVTVAAEHAIVELYGSSKPVKLHSLTPTFS
jgi:hypothetical protein